MVEIVLECRNLWKNYDKIVAVKNVSLAVNEGDIKLIFGPSGSGKSTLAKCLALLTTPTKGDVLLAGRSLLEPGVDLNRQELGLDLFFSTFGSFIT